MSRTSVPARQPAVLPIFLETYMQTIDSPGDEVARHHDTLALRVRYLPVPKPYVEPKARETETLAELKARVLTHFGLVEGQANGGHKEYAFSADGVIQTNLGVTLGALAAGKHTLELNLLEQFVQG